MRRFCMSPETRPLGRDDHEALARFIWQHNRRADGRVRCLHADQGDTPEAHERELATLPAGEHLWLAAPSAGAWVAVAGAEIDAGASRAWVRGPLVLPGHEAAAASLLRALPQALPKVQRFDAFWQADESALIACAQQLGWQLRLRHHVMEARASRQPTLPVRGVADARPEDHAAAMALHEAAFPSTYLPPAALLASLDTDHRLLVARGEAGVLGYCYAQHRPAEGDGYIDYLAVLPAARGRGMGRGLLLSALEWLFGACAVPLVSLTVREDSVPALGLYEAAGFTRVATGAQMVLDQLSTTAGVANSRPTTARA